MVARLFVALIVVMGLTAFAPAPLPRRDTRPKDGVDVASLVGSWKATRLLSNNIPIDVASNGVSNVTITVNQWVFSSGPNNRTEYDLKIDHTKKPAEINFYHKGRRTDGAPYGTGIIKREGNKIRIIYHWSRRVPMSFDNPPRGFYDLTLQQ
jgi:uncharacterized protein (TIGR03067 family)